MNGGNMMLAVLSAIVSASITFVFFKIHFSREVKDFNDKTNECLGDYDINIVANDTNEK